MTTPSLLGTAGAAGTGGASATADGANPDLLWSTGFELDFCDYEADGFCLTTGSTLAARYEVVTEPVHSGTFAAAFTVNSDKEPQARCVWQGNLPKEAYYGAWYYIPALAKNNDLWNLFHFQGDNTARGGHLWDVSLLNTSSGDLRLTVFSYLTKIPDQTRNPIVPVGSWFHIEMYLKRARDNTGEVILYQDGVAIFHITNAITDNSSGWAQWYVGNLAEDIEPRESTVYVDDVTVRTSR